MRWLRLRRISDQFRYLIVAINCLALTHFNDLKGSFRGGVIELRIFQAWIRKTRLTCCGCSSGGFCDTYPV